MRNRRSHRAGFGLIEVVLAAGILALVVGASVSLGRATLRMSVTSGDRLAAANLAQEGLELVRAIRDSAWVDEDSQTRWNTHLPSGGPYSLVYQATAPGPSEWRLTSAPSEETIRLAKQTFTRQIFLSAVEPDWKLPTPPPRGQSLRVVVEVTWKEAGQSQKMTASSVLTNWHPEQ